MEFLTQKAIENCDHWVTCCMAMEIVVDAEVHYSKDITKCALHHLVKAKYNKYVLTITATPFSV